MAINPEAAPSPEEEAVEAEILPFQKQENEIVKNLTEKYVQGSEISDGSKKVIDGFLAKDTEEGYQLFALAWFEDHKDQIQKEKGVPIEGVSNEWKINMVLSSKEKGGMGAAAEIRKGDYKGLGDEIDKIGVLRADMAKKQIPPETPFLLLNYLQKSAATEKLRIEDLKQRAERGDAAAGVEAASKEKQLEELFLAQKELVEKTMHEDLTQVAEKNITEDGFLSKENYLARNIDAKTDLIGSGTNELLIAKEWMEFQKLSEKERQDFQSDLGYGPAENGKPRWIASKDDLRVSLLAAAKENGIEGDAFYGLLQQGYKPYEVNRKRSILKTFVGRGTWREISSRDGKPFVSNGTTEDFESFVKNSGEKYKGSIKEDAQKRLEDEWDGAHDQKVRVEMEGRMKELAESPNAAEGGVEKVYEKARERIVAEYIKSRAEKQPKTAEQLKTIEKEVKESRKDININDFMSDVLFKRGRLEKLSEPEAADKSKWKKILGDYLAKDLGISWTEYPTPKSKKILYLETDILNSMTDEDYGEAMGKQTGLFDLIMKFMQLRQEGMTNINKEKSSVKTKGSKRKAA